MEATVFRRSNHWQPEILREPSDILHLPHLEFQVPLSAIYEALSATPDGKLRVTPL